MKKKQIIANNNQINPNVQTKPERINEQTYIQNQNVHNEKVQQQSNLFQHPQFQQQKINNDMMRNISSNSNLKGVLDNFKMPQRGYGYSTTSSDYGEFNKNY